MRPVLLACCLLPVLAACQSTGEVYPSLAIRDVERYQGQYPVIPVDPIDVPRVDVPDTGPLDQRLAALVAQGRAAHSRFTQASPGASRLANAARGAAVGSDPWASAQVALADLDSIRSEAAVALADLDTLFIAASVEASDRTTISAARDLVTALVREEDATLAQLRALVR